MPRRLMVPITASTRPSKACRVRVIVTEAGISWRWAVCGRFLRQHRPRTFATGCPEARNVQVGAALHRTMADGTYGQGRNNYRANPRHPSGWRDQPDLIQPF